MWGIILLSFVVGIALYQAMPEKMATHWNAAGEVNGYMPKIFGLFFVPYLLLFLLGLFLLIPKIDPLKSNIEKFRKYYDGFVVFLLVFLFYVHALTLAWNLGIRFNMTTALLPAMGLLFYYLGVMMEKAKRNWFIGIRTPWTLSSDRVWDKTHKLGAKLYKAAGVVALFAILFGKYAIFLLIIPIIFSSVYLFLYSYWEYRKEAGNHFVK